ncbi:unnamed protein product [Rotaria magnacalcarata]|uniref:Aminoacyl-tRNA synthetase class Ia domain-containing protein n=1 Tax=Rotaria magnacalcarata TaxID=392030 RepID=A0A8S2SV08_9BILA|nr:unnamed protein product [Rotaria magnacalcarata]CAF4342253.1 unnamed protein product [Rotaria magnacalcarata]
MDIYLVGAIEDIVTRWVYQTGHYVERRFGWDCHGLPVEYEIDKTLDIKGSEDVAKMDIATSTDHCRKIAMRYAQELEVMPYSMGCCTPLSNFEAGQNYKDTDDPIVWVSFSIVLDPTVKLVAWTTTP